MQYITCSAEIMKTLCSALMLMICIAATGCAGYRSGLASIPFVGEVEPTPKTPETTYELGELKQVQLHGVKLYVSLNNTIRTSDLQVMFFAVPMSFDPRANPSFGETDKLTVWLRIIPADSDFFFDPSGLTLIVDGQVFRPTITRLDDPAKFGAYLKSRASDDPALWSDLVDKEIALIKDKHYPFTMIFDCPVPTPERSISLDIGRALLHPRHPNIPTIRFMKIRWKQSYT
jgi:hypothetical protein